MIIITAKLCKDMYTNQIVSVSVIDDLGVSRGIPFDPANTDYQKYLQWLSEGNEPLPPDEVTE